MFGFNGSPVASISHKVRLVEGIIITTCESIGQWLAIPQISFTQVKIEKQIIDWEGINSDFCLCLGHIGSADVELSTNHLTVIQNQMQSKGGYDMNSLRMQVNNSFYFRFKLLSVGN